MAKKKATARPKKRGAGSMDMGMGDMGMGSMPGSKPKAPYQFRGRTIEIMPPSDADVAKARLGSPAEGMLHVDGRMVMYEQTDEGIYSHDLMYQRFSTPEELAEELVRQWGTHVPAPVQMPMPVMKRGGGAKKKKPAPRAVRRSRGR